MSEEGERPKRRKRYSGKNPRRFEDKYKELNPTKYGETVAKVLSSGKTPAGSHVPIMMEECLTALVLGRGMIGVDATLGFGGHALGILKRICPGGKLLGLDVDPVEQPKTEARIWGLGYDAESFEAIASNYAGIRKAISERDIDAVDFVFADLGCSSMQYDDPSRGFSFKTNGPLDMRMNPKRGLSAREWLLRMKEEKLERVLSGNSDEPHSAVLANALAGNDFQDTLGLANAVKSALGGMGDEVIELSIRRVFQAIRIEVNDEFAALDAFLRVLPDCLKSGGRAAILTFHSGEDRRVKKAFQAFRRNGVFAETSDGVVTAGDDERRLNPRSRPAKLRWAIKA